MASDIIKTLSPPIEAEEAAQAFAALGAESRLAVVRALLRAGPEGLTVGALQERVGMPASTLSHHLKFLVGAGLIEQQRDGRAIVCRAAYERLLLLSDFLTRECCLDRPLAGSEAAARSGQEPGQE